MGKKTIIGSVGLSAAGKQKKIESITTSLTSIMKSYVDERVQNQVGVVDMTVSLVEGSITSYIQPMDAKSIKSYLLDNCKQLVTANFGSLTELPKYLCNEDSALETVVAENVVSVGDYAFNNCTKVNSLSIGALENVGSYAFTKFGYSAGSNYSFDFTLSNNCVLGSYAFREANLKSISGSVSKINSYAIYNITNLKSINLDGITYLGSYALSNNYYVETLNLTNLSPTGVDSYAFRNLGTRRGNKSSQKWTIDLSNGTFSKVPQYMFGGESSSNKQSNLDIYLPKSISQIESSSFQYMENTKIHLASTPTLSSSNILNNSTNTKFYASPENLDILSGMTNWNASAISSNLIGEGKGYGPGSTLPKYTVNSGKAITWYSNEELTDVITVSSSSEDTYYCTIGANREVYYLKTSSTVDSTITITDGTNNYSVNGERFIPLGTTVTITASPTDSTKQYCYMLIVNGNTVISQNATTGEVSTTIEVNRDLEVIALYWNKTDYPFIENFSENTWQMIFQCGELGLNKAIWGNLLKGNTSTNRWEQSPRTDKGIVMTKELVSDGGYTYNIDYVDDTEGRYVDNNGKPNHFVLQFREGVKLGSTSSFKWHSTTGSLTMGTSELLARLNEGGDLYESILNDEIRACLKNYIHKSNYNGTSEIREYSAKVTLATMNELGFKYSSDAFNGETPSTLPFSFFGQIGSSGANIRKQRVVGSTNDAYPWTSSPYGSSFVYNVYNDGSDFGNYPYGTYGVAPVLVG